MPIDASDPACDDLGAYRLDGFIAARIGRVLWTRLERPARAAGMAAIAPD